MTQTKEEPKSKGSTELKVDPATNLPIGEMGSKFKKAMSDGVHAARQAAKPPPEPPPEPKEAPKEAPPEQKAPSEKPKGLPDVKNAPQIPETPTVSEEMLTPKQPKGDRIGKTPVAEMNFRQLEAQRDELNKANAEAQKKITELSAQIESWRKGETPEVSGMRKELEKYQELVSRYYLEQDPRFKAAFDGKIEQAIADAKEIVGQENADRVDQILRMPDGEAKTEMLKEMAAEMEDFEAIGLRRAYDDIRKLNRERQAELGKAKENVQKLKEYESLTKAEETKKLAEERRTHMEATLVDAAEHMPEFKPVPGKDDYNKQVQENIDNVRYLMENQMSPQQQAQLAVWAVRGYRSAEREKAQVAMIQKLQAAIEALQGAQPGIESGGTPKASTETPSIEGMAGRFRKFMSGQAES